MKLRTVIFLLILSATGLQAQKYTTTAGVRIGSGIGLTVQQKLWGKTTFEGILNQKFDRNEIIFTGLLQQHQQLISKRFNFYMGAGPHFGWNSNFETEEGRQAFMGVTGIVGVEFTVARFNITYDFKPALNINNGYQTFDPQTALSVRYVLIKHKKKKKKINWKFWEQDSKKRK